MNEHIQRIIRELSEGKIVQHRGHGNSMLPVIRSGQKQTLIPVMEEKEAKRLGLKSGEYIAPDGLRSGDAVFCKVGGNCYTHEVIGIRGTADSLEFQIARHDRKRINGWTRQVFGKCIRVED